MEQWPHRPQEPFLRTAAPQHRLHERTPAAAAGRGQRQHQQGEDDHQETAQGQARRHVVAGRVEHHVAGHEQQERRRAYGHHRGPEGSDRLRRQPPAALAVAVGTEHLFTEQSGPEHQRYQLQAPGQHRAQRIVAGKTQLRQRQGEQDHVGGPYRGAGRQQQRHPMRRHRRPAGPESRQTGSLRKPPGPRRHQRQQPEDQHGGRPRPQGRREADLGQLPLEAEEAVETPQQCRAAIHGLAEECPVRREKAHRFPVPQPQHLVQDERIEALELVLPLAFQLGQTRRTVRQLVEDALLTPATPPCDPPRARRDGRSRPPTAALPRPAPGCRPGRRNRPGRAAYPARTASADTPAAARAATLHPWTSRGFPAPGGGTSRAPP